MARRVSAQTWFLLAAVAVSCLTVGYIVLLADRGTNGHAEAAATTLRLDDIPFNGARAYQYLKDLCAIGPRPSGSPGMAAQQKLLEEHFKKLGGRVEYQRFKIPHPQDASEIPMANLIVRWNPKSKQRILLCAHYDTLPFPLRDPENPRGTFVGANDNASGVAVLMELAHDMAGLKGKYGVDFLLLDGEEFIFTERDHYFYGSEHFARDYAKNPPPHRYRWGVLLDMVGQKDLQLYQEGNSLTWRDTRPLVEAVWNTARRLGVREFVRRQGEAVLDDHLRLHDIGKIPCIDLIPCIGPDFNYPPWHTQADTPEQCSALSLAKVGWVLREWMKSAQ